MDPIKVVEDLNSNLNALREKTESLDKKYDGLLANEIKNINDAYQKLADEHQQLRLKEESKIRFTNYKGEARSLDAKYVNFLKSGATDGLRQKDFTIGSPATATEGGGILVPEDVRGLFDDNLRRLDPWRSVATVVQTPVDRIEFQVMPNDMTAEWIGEVSARNASTPVNPRQVIVPVFGLHKSVDLSNWALNDIQYNLESWMAGDIMKAFANAEQFAFVSGNGTAQPKGILTYAETSAAAVNGYEFGKVEHLTTASVVGPATQVVTFDNLISLQATLNKAHRPAASWMMNSKTAAQLRTQKVTDTYAWEHVQFGQPERALGSPVVLVDSMPDVAAGTKPIVYGDLSTYVIVDSTMMIQMRNPYIRPGFVRLYTERRVGGALRTFDAVKVLKMGAVT